MLSLLGFFSVGVGVLGIGLSQISSFYSCLCSQSLEQLFFFFQNCDFCLLRTLNTLRTSYETDSHIGFEMNFHSIRYLGNELCFYIPEPLARGYKTHDEFHKYRMKLKFISDSFYHMLNSQKRKKSFIEFYY